MRGAESWAARRRWQARAKSRRPSAVSLELERWLSVERSPETRTWPGLKGEAHRSVLLSTLHSPLSTASSRLSSSSAPQRFLSLQPVADRISLIPPRHANPLALSHGRLAAVSCPRPGAAADPAQRNEKGR